MMKKGMKLSLLLLCIGVSSFVLYRFVMQRPPEEILQEYIESQIETAIDVSSSDETEGTAEDFADKALDDIRFGLGRPGLSAHEQQVAPMQEELILQEASEEGDSEERAQDLLAESDKEELGESEEKKKAVKKEELGKLLDEPLDDPEEKKEAEKKAKKDSQKVALMQSVMGEKAEREPVELKPVLQFESEPDLELAQQGKEKKVIDSSDVDDFAQKALENIRLASERPTSSGNEQELASIEANFEPIELVPETTVCQTLEQVQDNVRDDFPVLQVAELEEALVGQEIERAEEEIEQQFVQEVGQEADQEIAEFEVELDQEKLSLVEAKADQNFELEFEPEPVLLLEQKDDNNRDIKDVDLSNVDDFADKALEDIRLASGRPISSGNEQELALIESNFEPIELVPDPTICQTLEQVQENIQDNSHVLQVAELEETLVGQQVGEFDSEFESQPSESESKSEFEYEVEPESDMHVAQIETFEQKAEDGEEKVEVVENEKAEMVFADQEIWHQSAVESQQVQEVAQVEDKSTGITDQQAAIFAQKAVEEIRLALHRSGEITKTDQACVEVAHQEVPVQQEANGLVVAQLQSADVVQIVEPQVVEKAECFKLTVKQRKVIEQDVKELEYLFVEEAQEMERVQKELKLASLLRQIEQAKQALKELTASAVQKVAYNDRLSSADDFSVLAQIDLANKTVPMPSQDIDVSGRSQEIGAKELEVPQQSQAAYSTHLSYQKKEGIEKANQYVRPAVCAKEQDDEDRWWEHLSKPSILFLGQMFNHALVEDCDMRRWVINAAFHHARGFNAFNDCGAEVSLANQLFGKFRIMDIFLLSKLSYDNKLYFDDAIPDNLSRTKLNTREDQYLAYLAPFNIDICAEKHEKWVDFGGIYRFGIGEEDRVVCSVGFNLPVKSCSHIMNLDLVGVDLRNYGFTDADIAFVLNDFQKHFIDVKDFFKRAVLKPKGLEFKERQNKVGVGDFSLFTLFDLNRLTDKVDGLQLGLELVFPSGKKRDGTEIWEVVLGNSGAFQIGLSGNALFKTCRSYFNPSVGLGGKFSFEFAECRRVPKLKANNSKEQVVVSDLDGLIAPVFSSHSVRNFAEYDSCVYHFADQIVQTRTKLGGMLHLSIGNYFYNVFKEAFRIAFFYDLFYKSRDNVYVCDKNGVYNTRALEEYTNMHANQISWHLAYVSEVGVEVNAGSKHVLGGKNFPKMHSIFASIIANF